MMVSGAGHSWLHEEETIYVDSFIMS